MFVTGRYTTQTMTDDSTSTVSHEQQAKDAQRGEQIRCAILTVSDTRTLENDESGRLIEQILAHAEFLPMTRRLVQDEPDKIEEQLRAWIDDRSIHVIITTGGTGIGLRDTTIDVVKRLLTIELEGFGELFRMLSWEQVKAAAMLSRTVGGLVVNDKAPDDAGPGERDTFIFALPGSTNAVRTAMNQLIVPQLPHLVWERAR